MQITGEAVTVAIGLFTVLVGMSKFLINRQDKAMEALRLDTVSHRNTNRDSIDKIHERINTMSNTLVRREDLEEVKGSIRDLKVDMRDMLDKNCANLREMFIQKSQI